MTPRGQSQAPAIDPEFAELIAGLYYALEDNLERCARLTHQQHEGDTGTDAHQRRVEALAGASRIAYVQRVTFEAITRLVDIRELPPGVLPIGVLGALARLAYALTALAEDGEPQREQLLTRDEIAHLPSQYAIEDWLQKRRVSNPSHPSSPGAP
ncbi:MAG TPA: hypothetical protein VMF14_20275 [Solirubrobacteraceae bacterium]|nr:hypothetical protein [Solirubrobacteraceae bacterium]